MRRDQPEPGERYPTSLAVLVAIGVVFWFVLNFCTSTPIRM